MSDSFALLQMPRRPWLDLEALKDQFLKLSGDVHPDRHHGAAPEDLAAATQRYADLNAAYQRLREPKDRLAHLLELERGAKPQVVQTVPQSMMDVCMDVGALCRKVDAFLKESSGELSPMLRVQHFAKAMDHTDAVTAVLQTIESRMQRLVTQLQPLNDAWAVAEDVVGDTRAAKLPLAEVEQIHQQIAYLTRWAGQLRERVAGLAGAGM